MKWYVSASEGFPGGFYDSHVDGGYEISDERFNELAIGQSQGKEIHSQKDGKPYLKSPAALTDDQIMESILINRRRAYAAESDPLYMEWQYDQTSESEQAWRQKVEEIKDRFPLPAVS